MKQLGIGLLFACVLSSSIGCGSSSASGGGGGTTSGTASTGTSGGGGGSSGNGGGGPAAAKACKEVSQARCDRLKACSNDYLVVQRYESDASCVSRLEANCEAGLAAPSTAQTAANIESCAAAHPKESCDDIHDQNPSGACLPPHGKLAAGDACAFDGQCATGWCQVEKTAACGKCGTMPAPGAACVAASECGYDQACPAKSHQCAKFVAQGGTCGESAPCGAGLTCVGAMSGAGGKCVAAVTTKGAACDPTRTKKADCDRDIGLSCDVMTKTCKDTTLAPAGMPCGLVSGEVVGCATGAACVSSGDALSGTCMKVAADDAACDSDKGAALPRAREVRRDRERDGRHLQVRRRDRLQVIVRRASRPVCSTSRHLSRARTNRIARRRRISTRRALIGLVLRLFRRERRLAHALLRASRDHHLRASARGRGPSRTRP